MATIAPDVGAVAPVPGARRPAWARWRSAGAYTVGAEEELMLLDPSDFALWQSGDAVRGGLSPPLRLRTSGETHAAVVELKTGVHSTAARTGTELGALRRRLALEVSARGLAVAAAGMHPLARADEIKVSDAERYRVVADSMRWLARREPTMALHIHVGVAEPEGAIRVLNAVRARVPILIALSANSPFWQGGESGHCSTRTAVFGAFPRTGAPRRFESYDDYVGAIDALIASGAVPDPTFMWWDVRLQPALGTVEVRAMDAQTAASEVAPLVALIQSLARLVLEGSPSQVPVRPEVLDENRFLAARDGLDARLIDPRSSRLVPVRRLLHELCDECRPHAAALGCSAELERLRGWRAGGGAQRQLAWARCAGVASVVPALIDRFSPA